MINTIIFDLDNTLYKDINFVKSGFKVVSKYLSKRCSKNAITIYNELLKLLKKHGRGKVFNLWLKQNDLYSRQLVIHLVYIYRSHKPRLFLPKLTERSLKKLKAKYRLGLITDGLASVQRNKIEALGIEKYFEAVVVTDEIPGYHGKPSNVAYKIVLNLIKASAEQACYVADDMRKDFIGPNKLGMVSIFSKQHAQENIKAKGEAKPQYRINKINQLFSLISKLNNI